LTRADAGSKLAGIEVHFTPEQELRLASIATREGIDPQELAKDATLKLLQDDAQFRAAVPKGVEQSERGEFIEDGEMDARVKRMLQP
jgi:predicted transcriptional regulator